MTSYTLSTTPTILQHGSTPAWLVCDGSPSRELQDLIAHVRSGDYLVTLATLLDSISDELTIENRAEATVLQQLIENLIYIDKNYKLIKK